ncbi:MAG: DUF86 domain-containing protein [Deltaproteobacteria bacterium]|nr:DUF86 domain-containing protein [Deltaproteobacteria bacterium]
MRRDPRLYIDDILEAIGQIREYTVSMSYDVFTRDRKTQDAVVRNLEIVGEAAGRLPEAVKERAGDIEWRKIVGLRNILAHEYFGVSLPVVWDVVQNKLDALETACRRLLKDEKPGSKEQE